MAGAALAGALGLLALLFLSHAAVVSWRSRRELRVETARLESQIAVDLQKQQELDTYFHSPAAKKVLDRSAFLNSLIDERSFPWTKIFMDLETTLPPGVRVVSISPRLTNGRAEVTLEIGAMTDEGKIQFLQQVEKSPVFSGMVVKEERRSDQPGADKIVLSLTVWYSTT